MGTGSFTGVKSGRDVTLTPHPLLVPWSRKGRAIPLLPPWAVRPVQSLSACTKVHFTLLLTTEGSPSLCKILAFLRRFSKSHLRLLPSFLLPDCSTILYNWWQHSRSFLRYIPYLVYVIMSRCTTHDDRNLQPVISWKPQGRSATRSKGVSDYLSLTL